jgi:hypothetical protein
MRWPSICAPWSRIASTRAARIEAAQDGEVCGDRARVEPVEVMAARGQQRVAIVLEAARRERHTRDERDAGLDEQ